MFPWSLSKNFFRIGIFLISTFRICNKIFFVEFSKTTRLTPYRFCQFGQKSDFHFLMQIIALFSIFLNGLNNKCSRKKDRQNSD